MSDTVKNLPTPDPKIMRDLDAARARDGVTKWNGCPHPMSAIYQFEDVITEKDRYGRPTNLFQCGICSALLWLRDAHGHEAHEG